MSIRGGLEKSRLPPIESMAFHVLSNGKQNVLKKMESYTTKDVSVDEIKQIAQTFIISFLTIEAPTLIVAAVLYKQAIILSC